MPTREAREQAEVLETPLFTRRSNQQSLADSRSRRLLAAGVCSQFFGSWHKFLNNEKMLTAHVSLEIPISLRNCVN